MRSEPVSYPILFTIADVVSSRRFLIEVRACGRALMVPEDDAWWLYGVEPGGIACSGESPGAACVRFTEAFKKVLTDIAEEARDFGDFERLAHEFFSQQDDAERARWDKAFSDLRSGAVKPDAAVSSMGRLPADARSYLTVRPLDPGAFSATRYDDVAMAAA
jgi:hypothetical protein